MLRDWTREELMRIIGLAEPAMHHAQVLDFVQDVLASGIQVRTVVEIGVHRCGSFRVWAGVFEPELIIGVDNNHLARELHAAWGLPGHIVAPAWSQDPATVREVTRLLAGRRADLLFVDGGHLEHEVRADVANYFPLLNRPAVVGFHDILASIPGVCDVPVVWDEVKREHGDWREYRHAGPHYGECGIGAIYLWS